MPTGAVALPALASSVTVIFSATSSSSLLRFAKAAVSSTRITARVGGLLCPMPGVSVSMASSEQQAWVEGLQVDRLLGLRLGQVRRVFGGPSAVGAQEAEARSFDPPPED